MGSWQVVPAMAGNLGRLGRPAPVGYGVKTPCCAAVFIRRVPVMINRLAFCVAGLVWWEGTAWAAAQTGESNPVTRAEAKGSVPEDQDAPNAVLIALRGNGTYAKDGTNFLKLDVQQVHRVARFKPAQPQTIFKTSQFVLNQGAVVRTGADSHVDLFLRRIGTTVRLQPDSEVKFEKMARHMSNGVPVMETVLAVRAGRIFSVVRAPVPGSTFEIRNEAGRAVVEGGGGKGRYIITADGTHVTEKGSAVPLKVIGESGITVIGPGMKYSAKDGKVLPLETSVAEQFLIDFDMLDSLADRAFAADDEQE
jgi:hypothetical protein